MEQDEFYKTLGCIAYSYTRIDFLMGYIGEFLGLQKSHIEFFAEQGIKNKVDKIVAILNQFEDEFFTETLKIMEEIQEKNNMRNTIMHGIALFSNNDIRFHKYKLEKKVLLADESKTMNISEFIQFNMAYISLHNKLFVEIQRIEDYCTRPKS